MFVDANIKINLDGITHEDFLWLTQEIESNLNMLDTGNGAMCDEITNKYEVIDE